MYLYLKYAHLIICLQYLISGVSNSRLTGQIRAGPAPARFNEGEKVPIRDVILPWGSKFDIPALLDSITCYEGQCCKILKSIKLPFLCLWSFRNLSYALFTIFEAYLSRHMDSILVLWCFCYSPLKIKSWASPACWNGCLKPHLQDQCSI